MIFEKREYTDGGPNDKGYTVGYIRASSKTEAGLSLDNPFQSIIQIEEQEFLRRKIQAEQSLKMFNI